MSEPSFKQTYAVLQRHAETLRNQREPNIDELLGIVNESIAAYKVCRTRIEAVEKALEQALGEVGLGDEVPEQR
jgi:exodeoxyribonuclease VII small subunit